MTSACRSRTALKPLSKTCTQAFSSSPPRLPRGVRFCMLEMDKPVMRDKHGNDGPRGELSATFYFLFAEERIFFKRHRVDALGITAIIVAVAWLLFSLMEV